MEFYMWTAAVFLVGFYIGGRCEAWRYVTGHRRMLGEWNGRGAAPGFGLGDGLGPPGSRRSRTPPNV